MTLWDPNLWAPDLWEEDLWEDGGPTPPVEGKIFCQYCGKMFFTDDDNVNYFFVSSEGAGPGTGALWAEDLWAEDLWEDGLWEEGTGGGAVEGFKRGDYTSPKRIFDIGAQILRCPVDPMPALDREMERGDPHPMRHTIR